MPKRTFHTVMPYSPGPSFLEFVIENLNTDNLAYKVKWTAYVIIGILASAIFFLFILWLLNLVGIPIKPWSIYSESP